MDDMAMIWFALRERRGSLEARSLLGESTTRRQTFAAAMAQFEEQMTAAKIVSPATRPLNLYYGLAQAGMAIAAAHAPEPWGFSSHGLKLVDTKPELPDIQVRTEGNGAFQKVASATGSPGISSPVSLGRLWASLPDLGQTAPLPGSHEPVALDLRSRVFPGKGPRASIYMPSELIPVDETDEAALSKVAARFGEIMTDYPSAKNYIGIPAEEGAVRAPENSEEQWSVMVEWPRPGPPLNWASNWETFFDGVAPEYRYRGDRFLRPSIDGSPPPSPLMTWWVLLFGFSILARYQPRKWVRLLDLDKPGCAAVLQFALEEALSVIPHLVLEALDGGSFVLAKPLAL